MKTTKRKTGKRSAAPQLRGERLEAALRRLERESAGREPTAVFHFNLGGLVMPLSV